VYNDRNGPGFGKPADLPWCFSSFSFLSPTLPVNLPQERFYFGDNVLPCFESGIPLLKERLQQLPDADNVSASQHRL
jgi:hypothetical protein